MTRNVGEDLHWLGDKIAHRIWELEDRIENLEAKIAQIEKEKEQRNG